MLTSKLNQSECELHNNLANQNACKGYSDQTSSGLTPSHTMSQLAAQWAQHDNKLPTSHIKSYLQKTSSFNISSHISMLLDYNSSTYMVLDTIIYNDELMFNIGILFSQKSFLKTYIDLYYMKVCKFIWYI